MKFVKNIVCIRGAITVRQNDVKDIKLATCGLIKEIFKQNKLDKLNVLNIIFTVTSDLNTANPATITRKELNLNSIPMLCVQEMKLKNGLKKCIRVLVQAHTNKKIKHIYLGKATKLRPDL